jgi:hypothetical protein
MTHINENDLKEIEKTELDSFCAFF